MKKSPTSQQLKDMDRLAKGKLISSALPVDAPLADKLIQCLEILDPRANVKVS